MKTYNYKAPFVKASTIQIDICDSESYSIGNIKRYYKTVFHWFFDMWVGEYKFFSNFRAVDSNGEKVIEAFKKNYIMKPSEYQFSFLHGPYKGLILTAIQDGITIIHPVYKVAGNNINMTFKKENLERVKIYENNQEVGRWHISFTENFKAHIVIEEEATIRDPLFYAIAGQILYFVGD